MAQAHLKDVFLYTSSARPSTSSSLKIICFIPGNPGLISYYHSFLTLLSSDQTLLDHGIHTIAGFSHGGFETDHSTEQDKDMTRLQYPPGSPPGPFFTLQDQVELAFLRIEAIAERTRAISEKTPSVVLIGHSVGAYIALEAIRKWHEKYTTPPDQPRVARQAPLYRIFNAILLTPTVFDIAKSPSGQKLTALTTYIPYLAQMAQTAAAGLRLGLPRAWTRRLVQGLTGMQGDALDVTVAWLSSRHGVEQALEMGMDEMRSITDDQWGEEVWGAASTQEGQLKPPKLIFYFADSDHWIGHATREQLVKARGRIDLARGIDAGKAEMFIEKPGDLTHSWCLHERQNKLVATKVSQWIQQTVEDENSINQETS